MASSRFIPFNEIPESWSLYYPEFALDDTKLEHITVKITRDDGIPIEVKKLYLEKTYYGLPGQLIIELTNLGISQCKVGHKVHVQVYILKTSKRLCIDYTFEIFDNNPQENVCFYETDSSKCPSGVPTGKRYGKGAYEKYKPATNTTRAIIYVAETLKPQAPLRLDFSTNIIVSQGMINGSVVIGKATECDFLYPELSDITIAIEAGSSLESGKLITNKRPRSLAVSPSGIPTLKIQPRNMIYNGATMIIKLLLKSIRNGDYVYNFNLYTKVTDVFITCVPVIQIAQYVIRDNQYAPTKDVVRLNSPSDISSISTTSNKVRIYFQTQQKVNMSYFTEEHDYELYTTNSYILL